MSVSLLDVNVLLALAWPTHVHHLAAHRWFTENHEAGWATCPLTQLGFVRLSMQPAVVKIPILFGDVMEALAQMTANGAHRFWPLDLAILHQGRLATFDRRILGLLPPDSVSRDALAIIPA